MGNAINREALEIAKARAEGAKRYAEMFPQFVHTSDAKYGEVQWQYENEGLKAVHPVTTKVDR